MTNLTVYSPESNAQDLAYLAILTELVDHIKVDTNQPALDPMFAKAMANSWKEHLKDRHSIPANLLQGLYSDALDFRAKNNIRTTFSVQDMISAWFRYNEALQTRRERVNYSSNFCAKCEHRKGLIVLEQNGKTIEVMCNHGR